MKPEIKQMITSLENRLLEEIYSTLENNYEHEDDIELQFNVGEVTYEALRVYRDDDGKNKYVHMLNGTAIAVGRAMLALIENYQNEDGSVTIPEVLVPLCGFDKIGPKN